MATNLFEGFSNKITGENFRCLYNTKESVAFEWLVQPGGYVPFEHVHLNQDEVFHIKSGELKVEINGREQIGRAGDTITIPRGKKHMASNNLNGELHCVVEFKPGLDTYPFFQCFGGLTKDNDMDRKGQINIPKMLYFTKKMNARCLARPSSIPPFAFSLALNFFYLAGTLLGWNKLYRKYTAVDGKPVSESTIKRKPRQVHYQTPRQLK